MVKHSHTDNLIARYGGDEFAILLGDAPEAEASCYAERMRRTQADHPFSHAR